MEKNLTFQILDGMKLPNMSREITRIEYDRQVHDRELEKAWTSIEERPNYELERRFTDSEGPAIYRCIF